jgi:hypothetical protein
MAVRYLRRAANGVAFGAPGAPVNGADDPIAALLAQEQRMAQLEQTGALIDLLAGADRYLNPQPAQASPSQALDQAMLQAQSVGPGAQFVPGYNPGGLMDAIAAFITGTGQPGFSMEEGARLLNRVPIGGAGAVGGAGAAPASNPYRDAIAALVAPLLESALAPPEKKASASQPSAPPIIDPEGVSEYPPFPPGTSISLTPGQAGARKDSLLNRIEDLLSPYKYRSIF